MKQLILSLLGIHLLFTLQAQQSMLELESGKHKIYHSIAE